MFLCSFHFKQFLHPDRLARFFTAMVIGIKERHNEEVMDAILGIQGASPNTSSCGNSICIFGKTLENHRGEAVTWTMIKDLVRKKPGSDTEVIAELTKYLSGRCRAAPSSSKAAQGAAASASALKPAIRGDKREKSAAASSSNVAKVRPEDKMAYVSLV
jgi:hypothetical protein